MDNSMEKGGVAWTYLYGRKEYEGSEYMFWINLTERNDDSAKALDGLMTTMDAAEKQYELLPFDVLAIPQALPYAGQAQAAKPAGGSSPMNKPANATTTAPAGSEEREKFKVETLHLGFTRSGDPKIVVRGGWFMKHGLPLYADHVTELPIEGWQEWDPKIKYSPPAEMQYVVVEGKRIIGFEAE